MKDNSSSQGPSRDSTRSPASRPSTASQSLALLLALIGFAIARTVTAEAADDFDAFAAHDENSKARIDHGAFAQILDAFGVMERGRLQIYYSALRQQGLPYLERYISGLANLPVSSLSRSEQMAYWLNLRNALVLESIAAKSTNRKFKSSRGDALSPGEAWTQKRVSVSGVSLSIQDIEKGILLRQFADPNLLYGLYQGSKGGPALSRDPFSGSNVRFQLRQLGIDYVNAGRAVRVKSGEARVPALYQWYIYDLFDGEDQAVIAHLKGLAETRLALSLQDAYSLSEKSPRFSYNLDEYEVRTTPTPGSVGGGSQGTYDYGAGGGGS